MMEEAVENLEKQMQKTDERLDDLALQVGSIEQEFMSGSDESGEIEVVTLLKSVHEVKSNYQNLRKEISEVQDLQRQLSTSLQLQIRMMQTKFNTLKEKLTTNVPQKDVPNILLDTPEKKYERHDDY